MEWFSKAVPILGLVLVGVGCGDSDEETGPNTRYYEGADSKALGVAGNQADCATCHANDDAKGRPGATLKNIAYHSSFKGGGAATLLDASNACIVGWMGGTALTDSDPRWMELEAYIESISDPAVTTPNAIAPEVLADEAAYESAYAGGDSAAGQAKYTQYCSGCHASGRVVGPANSPTLTQLAAHSVGRIAQQVRTAGPPPSGSADASDTTPGPMPFFEPSDLSVSDLKDIIAYIKS
ncbi:MAG: c-type cytochrome [Deltaproteobacteria bacterium]|nr:c-type cytochrome [Deltaproteobacteria bacterium]